MTPQEPFSVAATLDLSLACIYIKPYPYDVKADIVCNTGDVIARNWKGAGGWTHVGGEHTGRA